MMFEICGKVNHGYGLSTRSSRFEITFEVHLGEYGFQQNPLDLDLEFSDSN